MLENQQRDYSISAAPLQSTPLQSWKFADESIIRIGRALDNQFVLYSAVVSRHHVEVRRIDGS